MAKRELIVRGPTYFSNHDEDVFFHWLESIGCVREVTGHLRDLHISLKREASVADLRELWALFRRYGLPLSKLHCLKTARNAKIFLERTFRN